MDRINRQTSLITGCRLITIAVALVAATGCYTSHVRTSYTDTGDVQENESFEVAPAFDYEKTEVSFTNHVEGTGATPMYELRILEFPSVGENNQKDNLVTAEYYRSTLPGSHPLVVVLPIWGSFTYPPRKFTSCFQRRSNGAVHVLHVQGDTHLADWPGIIAAADESQFLELWREAVDRQRVTIVDTRRLIDWAEQRPEIDADKVALIGFSLGAFVAGTIATQEPRLAATVAVMGGSHLNTVIATCDGKRATRVQATAAEKFGWDREELAARLDPIMGVIDAANYPNRVDPERVLIIEADRDKCVPEQSREDLWLALGKPDRISMNYDHEPAFYSMTPLGLSWMRRQVWEFLETRLLE
jgi:pimeloyl-ACP methyl ester carboxylesterase